MSMQELPDDQLDGLFRKSLEESNPPYDPAAWSIMADKLTVHDRQQFWYRWLRRVLPVAVLFVLPVSLWLLMRNSSSADPTSKASPTQLATSLSARRSDARPSEKLAVHEADESATGKVTSAKSVYERNQLADQRTIGTVARASKLQSPTLTAHPSASNDPKQSESAASADGVSSTRTELVVRTPLTHAARTTRMARTKQLRTNKQSGVDLLTGGSASHGMGKRESERIVSDDVGGMAGQQLVVATADERVADRFQLPIEPLRSRLPAVVSQLSVLNRAIITPVADARAPKLPVVSQDRTTSLSLRAVVSPDLSSVGLTNFSRPGTNVGLLLDYQYQRWHVQAGVLRSVKVYQANESAYEYSAVRQWSVVPSSIDGRCNMLDIPINLRYDVALIPRQRALPPSRWFVSAGATTYYMLREDYTYRYDNPADPKIKYRDWTTETGRYGFSQLNLSGGYERAVTQRLFWQVEPFLKVPLKGVGFYKVNLLSTGAFFSLRYRL